AEDRLLFRLAKLQLEQGHKIDWKRLWRDIPYNKTQKQLQMRLKIEENLALILGGIKATDVFLDVGSGVGNVVAQVAIETPIGLCIGVEIQHELSLLSKAVIESANATQPRLAKVHIYTCDIRQPCSESRSAMRSYYQIDTPISMHGVSILLSLLSPVKATDVFLDVGSGVGNVVAQVAIETPIGLCIGVEIQHELSLLSKAVIESANATQPRLAKVHIYTCDIRQPCMRLGWNNSS
ncbi:LOW QUALITY PROTEIN: Hypothetical protein PHPALM_2955, partial [Phytophthora palmivora]